MAISDHVSNTFDSAKKFVVDLDIKKWAEDIGGSSAEAIEAAIYFGLSFGIGFLLKKYFKMLIICLIVSLVMIKGMEYFNFLAVDWDAVKALFGLSGATDFNSLINRCFDWFKEHVLLAVASVVGFLIGYKLG